MATEIQDQPLFGLIAEFDDPHVLVDKTQAAYDAGYRKMDAYTPFPVHGLSDALGLTFNWVPWIVLAGGVLGGFTGFFLQLLTNYDYAINIGGRPLNSWPAFIIITFELAILTAAGLGLVGMLALNNMPQPYHPVFNVPRFHLASHDRFFLCIFASDPKFDLTKTRQFLEGLGAAAVSEVEQDSVEKVYE